MITLLSTTPPNIVAFRATGEVTKADFDNTVFPEVEKLVAKTGKLNYLMHIDTDLANFTIGAWFKDALLGIKELTKWNRCAIVADSKGIIQFTNVVSFMAPGEFKGFSPEQLNEAISWCAEK